MGAEECGERCKRCDQNPKQRPITKASAGPGQEVELDLRSRKKPLKGCGQGWGPLSKPVTLTVHKGL